MDCVHPTAHLSMLYARGYQLLKKLCLTCSLEYWPHRAERRKKLREKGDKMDVHLTAGEMKAWF